MSGIYDILVRSRFEAAHRLPGHASPCQAMHGHGFAVEAVFEAQTLDALGMGADFLVLKTALDAATGALDHRCLNEVDGLADSPTAERLAHWIFQRLAADKTLTAVRVAKVTVFESADMAASYRELR